MIEKKFLCLYLLTNTAPEGNMGKLIIKITCFSLIEYVIAVNEKSKSNSVYFQGSHFQLYLNKTKKSFYENHAIAGHSLSSD